jgi:hypothetical protein
LFSYSLLLCSVDFVVTLKPQTANTKTNQDNQKKQKQERSTSKRNAPTVLLLCVLLHLL